MSCCHRDFAPSLLYRGLTLLGRVSPGATVAEAQAELDALAAGFVASHPSAYPNGLRLTVRPLGDVVTRDVKPALMALSAAVGFVHLIACVNVANLLLVRAKTRERELAVRRALGATRLRLIRQLLAENLMVAILGGACGLLLARLGVGVLDWLRPVHLPRQSEIAIDGVVMLWTAGLTVMSSITFGLVPALAFTRDAHGQSLRSSRAGSLLLRSRRLHRGLVVSEVALSIVPLIAAGLMLRTFINLLEAPIGFDPAHVVTARIPLNLGAFSTIDRRSGFYRDAIARVRELPGVDAASVGGPLPLAPVQTTQRFWRSEDREPTPAIGMLQSIMPGYFGVMGIPLRAGRDISDDDIRHRRRVVVVDERLAALLWNGEAIGKQLGVGEAKQPLEVVGVAGHIRAREIRDSGTPMIYVPSHVYEIEQTLVVKTRAPLSTIGPAIKRAVEALGPGRPVFDIRPMDDVVEASIDNTRFTMLVLVGVRGRLAGARGCRALRHARLSHLSTHAGIRCAPRVGRIGRQHSPPRDTRGWSTHRAGRDARARRRHRGDAGAAGVAVRRHAARRPHYRERDRARCRRGARRRRLAGLARVARRSDDGAARGVGRLSRHQNRDVTLPNRTGDRPSRLQSIAPRSCAFRRSGEEQSSFERLPQGNCIGVARKCLTQLDDPSPAAAWRNLHRKPGSDLSLLVEDAAIDANRAPRQGPRSGSR